MVKSVFVLGIVWTNNNNNMFIFSYNIEVFENNEWVTILRKNVSCKSLAALMLEDCYKNDPNGKYQIVQHIEDIIN